MPPRNNDTKKHKSSGSILPDDVAAKYELAEGTLEMFACEFGIVDLKLVTLEFADRLATAGYLKKKS